MSEDVERAREWCLDQLDRRPRSRAELARGLARRGVAPEAAEAVLTRLAAVGLVDDPAFARQWVAERVRTRGLARRGLSAELHRRGVEPAAIAAAVANLDPAAEEEAARRLVAARLPRLAGLPRATVARRLLGLLARRGYPQGLATRVVAEAVDAVTPAQEPNSGSCADPGWRRR